MTEEFEEVDEELTLLLNKHMICVDSEKHNPLVDKLLECLGEDEKKNNEVISSVIHRGSKDIKLDNKKSGIGKKSLSFLLKKALLCRGGFSAAPMLRDPVLPDAKLDNSRMDKILRAMLHKKIYPQRPTPKTTSKKYLDQGDSDGEECEEGSQKSRWVKTD
ncbi:hypothetical protein CDL12_02497 [Handroanthus impetiginosus]|uniref:Uncharacterized protein n=1 Tax=Handroanthus impetiginosus TaxID=429701 RepID=A0A2G9I4T7_9LAMI|nr:hypothetical protein CDL12_02497 [Handroanthus impetiginosus]